MSLALAIQNAESTSYMFGRDHFYDGPCARDYDPWEHAADLGLPIVIRDLPRLDMVACYSEKYHAIFVRKLLHSAVERCAIAHEIVHYEHGDTGQDREQERRADRLASRRLIRPSRLYELADRTADPEVFALEMNVTEHIMEVFLREHARQ